MDTFVSGLFAVFAILVMSLLSGLLIGGLFSIGADVGFGIPTNDSFRTLFWVMFGTTLVGTTSWIISMAREP